MIVKILIYNIFEIILNYLDQKFGKLIKKMCLKTKIIIVIYIYKYSFYM